MAYFTNFFLKYLFLMTPFFVLSMFLAATQGWSLGDKRRLALRVGTAALWLGTQIEQKFGRNVIVILSKITGLILAAMASQMIFTGIRNFLTPGAV